MRIGEVISSRFRILAVAGHGGMGTVYRAVDLVNGTTVALKLMHHFDGPGLARFGHDIGKVKVLDFGIAYRAHARTVLTATGTVLGTPGYMSPEQARGESLPIDGRADVFSLGCVLFECLAGKPAFQGAHALALLAKLLLADPPHVRDLVPAD